MLAALLPLALANPGLAQSFQLNQQHCRRIQRISGMRCLFDHLQHDAVQHYARPHANPAVHTNRD